MGTGSALKMESVAVCLEPSAEVIRVTKHMQEDRRSSRMTPNVDEIVRDGPRRSQRKDKDNQDWPKMAPDATRERPEEPT